MSNLDESAVGTTYTNTDSAISDLISNYKNRSNLWSIYKKRESYNNNIHLTAVQFV